jgi:uncharacterized membrane protein YeaQ/YmgE (transglycosylase-associated protein family)
MNAAYGIIAWIVIGALAGWIGSMIMGTNSKQGGLANVVIGMSGAVVGGWLSRFFFGDSGSTNGLVGSFLVALVGACVVIFAWRLVMRRAT